MVSLTGGNDSGGGAEGSSGAGEDESSGFGFVALCSAPTLGFDGGVASGGLLFKIKQGRIWGSEVDNLTLIIH